MRPEATCWFVYGLIDTADWRDAGAAARELLDQLPGVETGLNPTLVCAGRLGIVASAVPLNEYAGPNLEANLEDLHWLEGRARAHAAVIAALFEQQPIVPLRFGTLFSSVDRMVEELGRREAGVLAQLDAGRDQEEWTVRFCANPDQVAQQMAERASAGGGAGGQGAQYLLRRRMALKGRAQVAQRLVERAAQAHGALERLALESNPARTEIAGLSGGARSLLSRVYRIRRADRDQFLEAVGQHESELAHEGLTTLCSGPWPLTIGTHHRSEFPI